MTNQCDEVFQVDICRSESSDETQDKVVILVLDDSK